MDIEAGKRQSADASRRRHHLGMDGDSPPQPSNNANGATPQEGTNNSSSPPPPPPPESRPVKPPPLSRGISGLPLTTASLKKKDPPLRLIHPILRKLPLSFRFGSYGILSNLLFMVVYNSAASNFSQIAASTIYSLVYLLFIPIAHALASLLVFGWPERYLPSLMSNFPIGLTAIAIGGGLTAYLDNIEFNERIEEYVRDNYTFSQMPPRTREEKSEFYSSLVVLAITSIWTYILSVYINSPASKSEKKEN